MFQSTADDSIENDDITDHFFFTHPQPRGQTVITPTPPPSILASSPQSLPPLQPSPINDWNTLARASTSPAAPGPAAVSPTKPPPRRVTFGPTTIITITPRVTQETLSADTIESQSLFDSQSRQMDTEQRQPETQLAAASSTSVSLENSGSLLNMVALPSTLHAPTTNTLLSLIGENQSVPPAPAPALATAASRVSALVDTIDSMEGLRPASQNITPINAVPAAVVAQENPPNTDPPTPQQHEASFAQFEVFGSDTDLASNNGQQKKKRRTENGKASPQAKPSVPAEHSINANPWTLSKRPDTSQRDELVAVSSLVNSQPKKGSTAPTPTTINADNNESSWLGEQPAAPSLANAQDSSAKVTFLLCDLCHTGEVPNSSGMIVCPRPPQRTDSRGHTYPEPVNASITGPNLYMVHVICACWSPEVTFVSDKGVWEGLEETIARGAEIKCAKCRIVGATLGCVEECCQRSYHYPCALTPECKIQMDPASLEIRCRKHAKK